MKRRNFLSLLTALASSKLIPPGAVKDVHVDTIIPDMGSDPFISIAMQGASQAGDIIPVMTMVDPELTRISCQYKVHSDGAWITSDWPLVSSNGE